MRINLYLISILFSLSLLSCSSVQKIGKEKEQKVLIVTSEGKMVVKLYNETPIHRDNFMQLINKRVYDGVLFHRVIEDFMIQAGDPSTRTSEQQALRPVATNNKTLPAEIHTPKLYHKRGALSAARLGDQVNPKKESSAFQFYIVKGKKFTENELNNMEASKVHQQSLRGVGELSDSTYQFSQEARNIYRTEGGTPHLDGDYTVFGEVISGFDVIDKISAAETDGRDKPLEDVIVIRMRKI